MCVLETLSSSFTQNPGCLTSTLENMSIHLVIRFADFNPKLLEKCKIIEMFVLETLSFSFKLNSVYLTSTLDNIFVPSLVRFENFIKNILEIIQKSTKYYKIKEIEKNFQ